VADLDADIRRLVYEHTKSHGHPPAITELVVAGSSSATAIRAALRRLAEARVLVLQPETGEILMAPPFSAVPTTFVVETSRHASSANCAWDALGVPIMLRQPARVNTSCGCCGQALTLDVSPDHPPDDTAVIHFAVPAARWWENIVFT
jgi:hypothetical protein